MSERKYFDLQIVKFTSLNSSAFNKMFIKSYTLPCTFLGQLTAFKKFKDFVGGNVLHQCLCDFYQHLMWVRVCGRWVKDNFMSHINIYGGTVIFFLWLISLTGFCRNDPLLYI